MLRDEYGQRLPRASSRPPDDFMKTTPVRHVEPLGYRDAHAIRDRPHDDFMKNAPVHHLEPLGYRDAYALEHRPHDDFMQTTPVRHMEPLGYRDAHIPEDRYHDEPYYPPKDTLPWKWIAVFFLIVVVGMGVAIGVLVNKESNGGSAAPCTEVTVESTMRFDDLEQTDALKDKSSPEYAEFAHRFCKDLSSGLVKETSINECGKTKDVCDVGALRPGSIYVDFKVKAHVSKSEAEVENIKEELTKSVTDAIEITIIEGRAGPDEDNIFRNSVSEIAVEITAAAPVAQCPDLFIPEGATVSGHVQGASYAGDSLTIRCNPGFRVFDNSMDQYLNCRADGTWDNEVTACQALRCPELKDLENKVIVKGNATWNEYRGYIITKCKEGYSLDTKDASDTMSNLECQEDGSWDKELTECHALLCPEVTLPRNTAIESGTLTDNMFNNQITLTCHEDMKFEDGEESMTWTCNSLGQWDKAFEGCEATNGQWSEWSEFGECKSKCSDKPAERTRHCMNPPESASEVQLPCEGDLDIDYQNCTIDNTCVSLFAALTTKVEATTDDVDVLFDDVQIDKTGAFDGTHFTAHETGIYMFSLSGGAVDDKIMKLQLTTDDGNGIGAVVVEFSRTDNSDTFSRDVLIELTKGTRIRVVLMSGLTTSGLGNQRLTSLSIFSYSGLMKEGGAAFTSGMTEDVASIAYGEPVFKGVNPQFNLGNGFLIASGYFVAPFTGIYFFSFTSLGDDTRFFSFDCVGIKCQNALNIEGDDYDDYTLSRSLLFELNRGDKFSTIQYYSGPKTLRGSDNIDSSFSGFLYDPLLVEPVAFFAIHEELNYDIYHDMSPVYFTTTFVNEGRSFIDSILVARITGVYYIHYTMGAYYDDFNLQQFWLMKNGVALNGMRHDEEECECDNVLARSAIIELEVGDRVYLKADADTYFYSGNEYGYVSFLGLLLQ